MSFFALLLAFLAEQIRPLPRSNPVNEGARSLCTWAVRTFGSETGSQALVGWGVVVVLPSIAVWLVAALAWALHPLIALVFHVAVLWATLGFRQFSHSFTELQFALGRGDVAQARAHLQQWMRTTDPEWTADGMGVPEICRAAIEEGVVASHRNVYGVLFWYAVLGVFGAVFYKLAGIAREQWGARGDAFSDISRNVFSVLDWLPARMTAIGFAIVGNFEDALYGWRQRAVNWSDPQRGIVVESAAGALGVQLTPMARAAVEPSPAPAPDLMGPVLPASAASEYASPDTGIDEPEARAPDVSTLHAAVGLLWRSVVLWMVLLLLLSLVSWAS